jgi:hypothetical protein
MRVRCPSSTRRVVCGLMVVGVIVACSDNSAGPGGPPPTIVSATVASNPNSVLSTVVMVSANNADSVRVAYSASTDPGGTTPGVTVSNGQAKVVTLGLLPSTSYTNVVQVFGRGGRMVSDTVPSTTAALPTYIQQIHVTYAGTPSGGLTLLEPLAFTGDSTAVAAIDSLGRVRWYRIFPGRLSVEAKQQPNNDFTIFVYPPAYEPNGSPEGYGPDLSGSYIEFTPAGDSVAEYDAGNSLSTDAHELWLTGSPATGTGAAHLFGAENRQGDLSSIGGPSSVTVVGHHLRRQTGTGSGTVQFDWNAWNVYGVIDWIEPTGVNPPNDFDHPNALDFDSDSNYIVSFRHMGAVIKMNAVTGAIMWQLGGRLTQFTIVNDPLGLFSGQHGVRILPNGHILMYDNGLRHVPQHSRAVEYALDFTNMTATMVWEYEPSPMTFTPIVGSVQRLSNGNTLVAFAYAGFFDEVDANSHLVARGTFSWGSVKTLYRTVRLASLYKYQYLAP